MGGANTPLSTPARSTRSAHCAGARQTPQRSDFLWTSSRGPRVDPAWTPGSLLAFYAVRDRSRDRSVTVPRALFTLFARWGVKARRQSIRHTNVIVFARTRPLPPRPTDKQHILSRPSQCDGLGCLFFISQLSPSTRKRISMFYMMLCQKRGALVDPKLQVSPCVVFLPTLWTGSMAWIDCCISAFPIQLIAKALVGMAKKLPVDGATPIHSLPHSLTQTPTHSHFECRVLFFAVVVLKALSMTATKAVFLDVWTIPKLYNCS